MNCLQNILLPSRIGGIYSSQIEQEAISIAKKIGVEHCLKKFPFELSGGEQQRINVIRALSLHPNILLCDEPTGNLDSQNSGKVISLISSLAKEKNSTLIVVTHDDKVASKFQRQIIIEDGKVFQ